MAPYRVDGPRVEIRRVLVPIAILGVVLGMAVVTLTLLVSLLLVGSLLWGIAFPPLGENLAALFLPVTAPFVPVVWFVGGLLLWGLRGILRGLLD